MSAEAPAKPLSSSHGVGGPEDSELRETLFSWGRGILLARVKGRAVVDQASSAGAQSSVDGSGSPGRLRRSLFSGLVVMALLLFFSPLAEGWSSRTVPGLVSGQESSGSLVPVVPGIVLDGNDGLSTSLQPVLRWPGAPSGQKQFEVLGLGGKSLWRLGVSQNQTRVNPGVLKQGGAYRWRATASGRTFDGGLFRVDMQRADLQGAPQFGGVSVGTVSGEAIFSWSSPSLVTVGGDAGFSLSHQPSNSEMVAPQVGIPSGWQLTAGGGSPWVQLKVKSSTWIELVSSTGAAIPFSKGSGGLWNAQLGAGENWPVGSEVSLSQASDGTWSATNRNGVVTLFPKAGEAGDSVYVEKVWKAGEPSVQMVFGSTGRLKALRDPVGGRFLRFIYRGINETDSLKCVEPKAANMRIAPEGYLCLTSGWEQPTGQPRASSGTPQRNRFFYAPAAQQRVAKGKKNGKKGAGGKSGKVRGNRGSCCEVRLARIVQDSQAGGQLSSVTDLAYDSVGRLFKVRSPLATQAVAAGVLKGAPASNSPDVLTTVSYDDDGRVSRITRPAPLSTSRTGERAWRSFSWSTDGGSITQTIRGPDTALPLSQVTSTLASMLTTRTVDSVGQVTTTEWNTELELPTQVTSPGGMVEKFSYDSLGNRTEQRGPSTQVDGSGAPVARSSYDTQLNGSQAEPMKGLQVLYFKGREFQGAPAGHDTGPRIGSTQAVTSLDFNWPESPINSTAKEWSARLFGYVRIPQEGSFTFTNSAGTALWAGGQLCAPNCSLQGLKAEQMLPIQLQVASGANGSASVRATWSGPGASGPIPSTNLRPGYTMPSEQAASDVLTPGSGVQSLKSSLSYDANDPMRPTEARSPSGLVSSRTYEPFNPGAGEFGRSTGYLSAAGTRTATTYYGQHDLTPVPNECPGIGGKAFDQAGMPRAMEQSGGLRATNIYDDAGRVVAFRQNGRLTSCQSFDAAGNPKVSYFPAWGDSPSVTTTFTYNDGGNPLRSVEETRQGSTVRTSSSKVDILGREIQTTDPWKTTTSVTFDSFDRPVQTVARTGTGQETVTSTTYDAAGNVESITVDGQKLGTFSYNSLGKLTSATYSNGSSASFSYDQNGALSARTMRVGGQEIGESVETAPSGRILGRTLNGPGAQGGWEYSYDSDGRLTSADLTGTMPAGVTPGTWSFEVNDSSQRTAITRPGTGPGSGRVEYTYGGAGEMEGTTDTRFGPENGDQFIYDDLDRATRVGPLRLAYDASGAVAETTDGTTTVRYILAGGEVIGETVTAPDPQTGQPTTKSARYSAQGLILCPKCEAGTAISRVVPLPGGVKIQIPIARKSQAVRSANSDWRYEDLLGNVAWEAVGAEAPSTTAIYDPDGNQVSSQPALSLDPTTPNLRYRGLQTAPTDPPIVAMGQRSYIPSLGVFLQPDPIANAGPTPFNYANGDPINYQDNGGKAAWSWAMFTKVAIGVVVGGLLAAATSGTGSYLAVALINGLIDAAVTLGTEALVVGAKIPDSDGRTQDSINGMNVLWAGLAGAAFGVATKYWRGTRSGVAQKVANQSQPISVADEVVDDPVEALKLGLKEDNEAYQDIAGYNFQTKVLDQMKKEGPGSNGFENPYDLGEIKTFLYDDPNQLPDFFKPYPGMVIP